SQRASTQNTAQRSANSADELTLGSLVCSMAQNHVRNLMSHHSGDLRFVVRCFNGAAIYVNRSAGKREGIDLFFVDDLEGKWKLVLVGSSGDKLCTETGEVVRDVAIGDEIELLLCVLGSLFSQLDVLRGAESIEAGLQPGPFSTNGHGYKNQRNDEETSFHGAPFGKILDEARMACTYVRRRECDTQFTRRAFKLW